MAAVAVAAAALVPGMLATVERAGAATPAPCTFSQLALAHAHLQGAAGEQSLRFVIADVTRHACTLEGWPTVTFTTKAPSPRPIRTEHVGPNDNAFAVVPVALATVTPRRSASFGLAYEDAYNQSTANATSPACKVTIVTVRLPGMSASTTYSLPLSFNSCFADYVVRVTPIEARGAPKER